MLAGTATQQRYAKRQVSLIGVPASVQAALAREHVELPSFEALEQLQRLAA